MYSYIVRRLAFGLVTIFVVSVLVFVILRILPGDLAPGKPCGLIKA